MRIPAALAGLFALAVGLSAAGPAAATCGEECDSEYASAIDSCKLLYGDDPADAADLANCISEARDDYRSCLDNCAADNHPPAPSLRSPVIAERFLTVVQRHSGLVGVPACAQSATNPTQSQPTMKFDLSENRRSLTITFPQTPTATFHAEAIDSLLTGLGQIRAQMWPPYSAHFPSGQTVTAIQDPVWQGETVQSSADMLFHIRDPRFGWLHYKLSPQMVGELIAALNDQIPHPSRAATRSSGGCR
jgi:hypothetical protein